MLLVNSLRGSSLLAFSILISLACSGPQTQEDGNPLVLNAADVQAANLDEEHFGAIEVWFRLPDRARLVDEFYEIRQYLNGYVIRLWDRDNPECEQDSKIDLLGRYEDFRKVVFQLDQNCDYSFEIFLGELEEASGETPDSEGIKNIYYAHRSGIILREQLYQRSQYFLKVALNLHEDDNDLGLETPILWSEMAGNDVSYDQHLEGLLQFYCTGCHGPGKSVSHIDLSSKAAFLPWRDEAIDQVLAGDMPPNILLPDPYKDMFRLWRNGGYR